MRKRRNRSKTGLQMERAKVGVYPLIMEAGRERQETEEGVSDAKKVGGKGEGGGAGERNNAVDGSMFPSVCRCRDSSMQTRLLCLIERSQARQVG